MPVLRNSDNAKLFTAEMKYLGFAAHKDPKASAVCILLLEVLFKEENCKTPPEHWSKAFFLVVFPTSLGQETNTK